jgi:hypothetical protein
MNEQYRQHEYTRNEQSYTSASYESKRNTDCTDLRAKLVVGDKPAVPLHRMMQCKKIIIRAAGNTKGGYVC